MNFRGPAPPYEVLGLGISKDGDVAVYCGLLTEPAEFAIVRSTHTRHLS